MRLAGYKALMDKNFSKHFGRKPEGKRLLDKPKPMTD
jgi:hypothetical protein